MTGSIPSLYWPIWSIVCGDPYDPRPIIPIINPVPDLITVTLPPSPRTDAKIEVASAISVADASKRSCIRTNMIPIDRLIPVRTKWQIKHPVTTTQPQPPSAAISCYCTIDYERSSVRSYRSRCGPTLMQWTGDSVGIRLLSAVDVIVNAPGRFLRRRSSVNYEWRDIFAWILCTKN